MNQPRIISIKDLNRYIKGLLEDDDVLADVWVRGEISNFTHHSSGHMYFTLKDKDSRVKCIMFASYNQRLPFMPKEGTRVIARGNISVYERDGQYQFYVTQMQPDGVGSLYLAYEQLEKKARSGRPVLSACQEDDSALSWRDRRHYFTYRGGRTGYRDDASTALSVRADLAVSGSCARESGGSVDRSGDSDNERAARGRCAHCRTRRRLPGGALGV